MRSTTQHCFSSRRASPLPISVWGSLAALLVVCGLRLSVLGQEQSEPLRSTRLNAVVSSSLFRGVNRNDATAAIRLWANTFIQAHGFQANAAIDVVDDMAEVRKRVLAGSVGIVALDVVEYFQLADLPTLEPVFCALGEGSLPPRYMLLVRRESGISSLEGLRGKTVIIQAKTAANLGQVWVDALLYDARLGRPNRFFHFVETVPKPSSAILPVFFGKADAAVVDEPSFNVANEMNPQLDVKLRVLAVSQPLAEGLLCICKNQLEYREEFLKTMGNLRLDPQAKQVFLIFRFNRLLPLEMPVLAPVRELWRKHNLLMRLPDKASAGSPSRQETHPSGEGEGQ